MKKSFLFKWVSVLGAMLLLATSVMPGLSYVFAVDNYSDPVWEWMYVYDESTWNEAVTNWWLAKYYAVYPSEDLRCNGKAASFNDLQYEVEFYSDAQWTDKEKDWALKAGWVNATVQKVTDTSNNVVYFMTKNVETDGTVYELFTDNTLGTTASKYVKIKSSSYPGCEHTWDWVLSAPNSTAPWIVINFKSSFTWTIKFTYEGKEDVYPWISKWNDWTRKVWTSANWGLASFYEEFQEDNFSFLTWAKDGYNFNFDINKFNAVLVPAHNLTIHYVYSKWGEAADDYTWLLLDWTEYIQDSPVIWNYIADITTVNGTITADVEVTVTYSPTNDNNGNQIADEEETTYTISFDTNWWTSTTAWDQTKLPGQKVDQPTVINAWNVLVWWFDWEDNKFDFNKELENITWTYAKSIVLTAQWEAMSDSTWWVETPAGETFTWVILESEEPSLTSSEESNITTLIASNNSTAAMEWVVELNVFKDMDWDGTKDAGDDLLSGTKVNFTSPKVVRIPVNTTWDVFIKVRHNGETTFSTAWLTTSSTATCMGWVATPAYVEGTPITPTSWYAEIYTCSASTFVAYTETSNPAPTYSGWGGGSSKSNSKTETKDETEADADNTDADTTWAEEWTNEETPVLTADEEQAAVAKFWQEQIDAYKWALQNGITTMKTVEDARLDKPLTRAELAKMMVVYIQKVLEKEPVLTWDVTYADVSESLGNLAGYIKLAYQYQIMWINADGTPIEAFNPNGLVTRWEYATVFSRVLFGDKFNKEWADFYTNHLAALEKAGVLKDTTPTMKEIRWWVMLMMYRSSQNADDIQAVAAETEETASDEAASDETVSDETASDETTSDETPAEEIPAEETPAEETAE